ncbi:S8 family serine peptidase [Micromonospora humida]|uniref:Peptidase S8 and S53 subtilisin kexin sedolisin n=1 Tax=Micromonospora humida TaxID=2809018 RepID=A0ABS2IPY3_9ACTN|nr:S8 family serine peptidase [Micromonospora humida]MBM7075254.1 peptidase S8 and S53 subtilisin kexin sedolisin [Micromonospora humida]
MSRLLVSWTRSLGCLVATCALVLALPTPVRAAPPPPPPTYVKYYPVSDGSGDPVTDLTGVAARFLADPDRADEVYRLNEGRRQPDGGALTAVGQRLSPGWLLVLPWDASGDEVRYGLLPATIPTAKPARPAAGTGGAGCVAGTSGDGGSPWTDPKLSPARAWPHSTGAGALVAVVDSGIDGELAALAGRVAPGSDVITGKARADTDCLGTGTAMASVIAAASGTGSPAPPVVGVAPEAAVLPVRIVAGATDADPQRTALGIEVAVSAGATVVALGGYAKLTDPAVTEAVRVAVAHDVVVVAPAATADGTPAPAQEGLLRVAGVGPDHRPVLAYPAGGVDVTAPGRDVPTLGVGGTTPQNRTGTEYAVAYVAGVAALVRTALPGADAVQVARRITATAAPGSRSSPSPENGWGMVDPLAAVSTGPDAAAPSRTDSAVWPALVAAGLGFLLLAVVGVFARRARRLTHRATVTTGPATPTSLPPASTPDDPAAPQDTAARPDPAGRSEPAEPQDTAAPHPVAAAPGSAAPAVPPGPAWPPEPDGPAAPGGPATATRGALP